MPKYLTENEKKMKHDLILNTAIKMFDESSYGDITMSNLAKRCGIAKGTIFKYFPTKETLFSCILYQEYDNWVNEELDDLKNYESFDRDSYIEFTHMRTRKVLNKRNRFVRLTSIKRTILDKNISVDVFSEKMENLTNQIREIARVTVSKTEGIDEEDFFNLYQSWHMFIVGAYNLAISEYNTKKLIELNKGYLANFNIEESILKSIDYYIIGLFYKNTKEKENGKI